MASIKGRLLDWLGGVLLREVVVAEVAPLGDSFRRLRFEGGSAGILPGDKAQILLPGQDVRTYTPFAVDERGFSVLVFLNGDHPAARWGRTVRVGDRLRYAGPSRSVSVLGPVVVFGDETSIGLARSYGAPAVLEVGDPVDVGRVVEAVGVEAVLIPRRPGDGHFGEVVAALNGALAAFPGATLAMTGRAASIRGLRSLLSGASAEAPVKAKPYWAEGKVALD